MKSTPAILSLILAATLSSTAAPQPATPQGALDRVVYTNRHYGFRLTLPSTWRGYTVHVRHRQAQDTRVDPGAIPQPPKQNYTVITVRHPRWTEAHPREDLPVMIFTRAQWKLIEEDGESGQNGGLVVSAAPFPPSELSRNTRYVFALSPRYNYDYSLGWQALERILNTHPLQGF